MIRSLTAIFALTLLSACVVEPADHARYRSGGVAVEVDNYHDDGYYNGHRDYPAYRRGHYCGHRRGVC